MGELKNCCSNSKDLANYLRRMGEKHRNYRLYTSMDRALAFTNNGMLFISDGQKWNDVDDRGIMKERSLYATCFSCSTQENVAMWMLYGAQNGRNGAQLIFYKSTIKELLNKESIVLGKFDKYGKFQNKYTLKRLEDFDIYVTDVLYVEKHENGSARITCGEDHANMEIDLLNQSEDIFYKDYAWSYEKECRLVVKLMGDWIEIAQKEELSAICVQVSREARKRIKDNDIVRSPVYAGGVECGKLSTLTGRVDWKI